MPRQDLFPVLDPKAQRAGRKLAYRCIDCGHEDLFESPQASCEQCEGEVELVAAGRT